MWLISISTISLQYWYCLYCSNNRKMSLQVSIGSSTASWPINFQNSQGFSGKILSYSIQRKIISISISKVLWKTSHSNYTAINTHFLRFYIQLKVIRENLIFILNYSCRLLFYQKALPHIIINTDFLKVSDILVPNWNIKCQLELMCVQYDFWLESAWNKNTPFKPKFAWKINTRKNMILHEILLAVISLDCISFETSSYYMLFFFLLYVKFMWPLSREIFRAS